MKRSGQMQLETPFSMLNPVLEGYQSKHQSAADTWLPHSMAATTRQRKKQLSYTPMLSLSLQRLIRGLGKNTRPNSLHGEHKTVLRSKEQRMYGYLSWLALSHRQYVDPANRDILAKRGSVTTKNLSFTRWTCLVTCGLLLAVLIVTKEHWDITARPSGEKTIRETRHVIEQT